MSKWIEYTDKGILVTEKPTIEEYLFEGSGLAGTMRMLPFIIGQFICYGEKEFGEDFAELYSYFDEYSYGTVANYASVMRRVPYENCYPKLLSFTHHAKVASYPRPEQKKYLEMAIAKKWTSSQMENFIKFGNPDRLEPDPETEPEKSARYKKEKFESLYDKVVELIDALLALATGKYKEKIQMIASMLKDGENG